MPKLMRRTTLLAKVETTYNVDAVPTPAANGIRIMDVSYGLAGQRKTERPIVHSSLAKLAPIIGPSLFTMSGSVFISGSGTAGTAPRYGAMIRGCSCDETIVAGVSVAYGPVSNSALQESLTIHINEDGILYPMTGSRGNMTMEALAGQPGKFTFNMTGHLGAHSDQTQVEPTYDTALPPVLKSAGFTVGSYAAVISGLNFDLQNEVVTPDDVNSPDTYGEIIITGREITGSIDPEMTAVATKDFLTEYQGGATYPLSTGVINTIVGNRWQLSQPAIQYSDWGIGDKSGIRTNEMPYMAVENTGDDDFTLTLT